MENFPYSMNTVTFETSLPQFSYRHRKLLECLSLSEKDKLHYRYFSVPFIVKTFTGPWPLIWITQLVPSVKQELLTLSEHPEFVGPCCLSFFSVFCSCYWYSKIQSTLTVLFLFYNINIVSYCLFVRFWWATFYKNWSLRPFERQHFSILFILSFLPVDI